ncbi:hypothetical protein [Rhodohalobacter sulfatireducens]|uniref:HEPN AbiU2-like domain-containing protein n=1 Tax=Rhodohalobacter sulfatireducens TaxID=2911366 RepID=A0ABS9KAB5_9BACT|nr:hypothetical protein [Rhodohalobacter sulfatireducens]MCG2587781.1 hypothetical protein [Rhodohalobacter sulfatireducens]
MDREEIIAHLKELRDSVLYTGTLLHQMNLLIEWEENDPDDEAGIRGQFFGMISVCFYRVIVLECYKLIWDTEHQNLYQFLNQLSRYYDEIKPEDGDGRKVEKKEYVNLIRMQKKSLSKFDDVKDNIQKLRNNLIAHSDKDYYLNKYQVSRDFPVSWAEINELLDLIKLIIRKHYSLLTNADIDMSRIHSSQNARLYLTRLRAMERFWKNKNINKIRKSAFFSEDYNPDDVFMK